MLLLECLYSSRKLIRRDATPSHTVELHWPRPGTLLPRCTLFESLAWPAVGRSMRQHPRTRHLLTVKDDDTYRTLRQPPFQRTNTNSLPLWVGKEKKRPAVPRVFPLFMKHATLYPSATLKMGSLLSMLRRQQVPPNRLPLARSTPPEPSSAPRIVPSGRSRGAWHTPQLALSISVSHRKVAGAQHTSSNTCLSACRS